MFLRKTTLAGLIALSAVSFPRTSAAQPPHDSKMAVVELKVTPVYPAAAMAQHLSGEVSVRLAISETGDVLDARVVSGDPVFAESAITAARQWKFAPSYKDGTPRRVATQILFRFDENPTRGHDAAAVASSTSTPARIALTNEMKRNTHCPEPKLVHNQTPEYPNKAKVMRLQGSVELYVLIDEAGNVTGVFPLSGPEVLRNSAVYAQEHRKYAAYTCEGQPARLETTARISYTMTY